MKFYIATKKHGFVEVEAEPFEYNGIECFVHVNEDNTYNVSSAHPGYAFVINYYNKGNALEEARSIIDKHKNKFLDRIEEARKFGCLAPNYQ